MTNRLYPISSLRLASNLPELFFHPVVYEWYLTDHEYWAMMDIMSEDECIWLFLFIYCDLHWQARADQEAAMAWQAEQDKLLELSCYEPK